MALAFLLAGLTFGGMVRPWHIVTLAFALGIANAFDAPARQVFVWELVSVEDLTNAVGPCQNPRGSWQVEEAPETFPLTNLRPL